MWAEMDECAEKNGWCRIAGYWSCLASLVVPSGHGGKIGIGQCRWSDFYLDVKIFDCHQQDTDSYIPKIFL